MRRKDFIPVHSAGRGRSLIATRINQQQQRKMQSDGSRSVLPRSYSSPSPQNDPDDASPENSQSKSYIMRSFSSPEPKHMDYRRNSDSFYRPKSHGSRSELDSDLDNFEQFEEAFIDVDTDQEQTIFGSYRRSPEREEPKKVVTALLPGSGLQRITIRPISSGTTQTLQRARDAVKGLERSDRKGMSRLKVRPLRLMMPARPTNSDPEPSSPSVEELQASPQLELEASELERQLENAEQHMEGGVAMATEESDADTVQTRSTQMIAAS